jgi:hypothetical protein
MWSMHYETVGRGCNGQEVRAEEADRKICEGIVSLRNALFLGFGVFLGEKRGPN